MKPGPAAQPFPVVGLGASAGGLEALEKFFAHVPPGSGLAFVVVQHLDPNVVDLMPELLQRVTTMAVQQAKDRMPVAANCVYVIPPNKDLAIRQGTLHLSAPTVARGMRLPIDFFLGSMAEDLHERSIGVILSGMGSDGTQGLRAIKAQGGLCLAQAPAGARFPSMPRAAIEAGLADLVGEPEELPGRILARIRRYPRLSGPAATQEEPAGPPVDRILELLRVRTSQAFSLYKKTTVLRRIERRMGVHKILTASAYASFLEGNPGELDLLAKELLIGVTSFFRDPAVWRILGERVFPDLFRDRAEGRTFRAWVAGCSTGEEAYGLAIVFREALARIPPPLNCSLQIFATDLDRDAIARARQGLFKPGIAAEVAEERLAAFFTAEEGGYRVRKEIREMVVFAPQNLIMDPPFTRLDLLTCRNLLIYLVPELQKKLLAVFHYSLVPNGLLCLGSSESIGAGSDLFTPLDAKARLFRRAETLAPPRAPVFPPVLGLPRNGAPKESKMPDHVPNLAALADHLLLQQFSPPAVLVNEAGDILYISGHTGKYLEPAAGKANWNLFAMARDGLRVDLAATLHRAARQEAPVIARDLTVGTNGGTQLVNLTAQRLAAPGPLQGLIMVVFQDQPAPAPARKRRAQPGDPRTLQLEQQLGECREQLHGLQQEMQISSEELKSANEELQSTNEELQSTNEELTTSKEELQSLNEELQTINAEQQSRMDELARTSSDMKNLLDATDIATVFLDAELRVGRFTSGASRLYHLLPADVGRPLTDLSSAMLYGDLPEDARAVLHTLVPRERAIRAGDGRWFLVRIMPYRTPEDRIDGVVITFTDTTLAKTLEGELRATAQQLQTLLDHLAGGYVLCDLVRDSSGRAVDGRPVQANRAFRTSLLDGRELAQGLTLGQLAPALGELLATHLDQLPATGEPLVFAQYLDVGRESLEVIAYQQTPGQFVCTFRDVRSPSRLLEAFTCGDVHEPEK